MEKDAKTTFFTLKKFNQKCFFKNKFKFFFFNNFMPHRYIFKNLFE